MTINGESHPTVAYESRAKLVWAMPNAAGIARSETQVAMDLADETTLNPSEAMMAIRQLRKILLRCLLSGENVKLGNWGSFSITLSSEGSATKAEVTARNIKGINLNFQPDDAFKTDLQKATFAGVDKLAEGRSATTDSGSGSNSGSDSDGDQNENSLG